jgi:hypothetical protein
VPELAVVAVLGLLVGSLVALGLRTAIPSRRATIAVAGVASAAACALLAAAATHRVPPSPPEPDDRPARTAAPGDVTSTACRSCHPREYETWHASYHRTMTQIASADTVLGDFSDVRVAFGAERYRMFERDGEVFAETNVPLPGNGGRADPAPLRLVQTTGSHHMQIYWFASGAGRMLDSLPLVWLREQQRWIPRRAAFVTPPSEAPAPGSIWNYTCIGCHSTHPRPRVALEGEAHADSHVTEFGIACEACHGGGERHLGANSFPLRRYALHLTTGPDATIVNPARLEHDRSAQVCGQCHAVKTFYSAEQASDWAASGWRFSPGDDLEATASIVSNATLARPFTQQVMREFPDFVRGSFWDDGIVRVTGREYNALLESGCFRRGTLACTSCHEMHRAADDPRALADWADDQLAPGMEGDLACTQCHPRFADARAAAEHAHHQPGSTGSACQNCHMPHATYGLLKAVRSHEIGSPRVITAGPGSDRPNACNLCHLDRPLAWSAEHLGRWYGADVPELDADDAQVAAGVRWALQGDAGVRALVAWSMGWAPAQQAAGTDWLVPYLLMLMEDPYDAVRIIATRSVRTLPGFAEARFDALADPGARAAAAAGIFEHWMTMPARERGPAMLFDAHGQIDRSQIARLLEGRDNRPVNLAE